MTARPFLPKYFPDFDSIMWMDADTWVQRWQAVEAYFVGADKRGLAVTQELHRSYASVYNNNFSRKIFTSELHAGFGQEIARQICTLPMLNSGCLAMLLIATIGSDGAIASARPYDAASLATSPSKPH